MKNGVPELDWIAALVRMAIFGDLGRIPPTRLREKETGTQELNVRPL